MAVFWAGLLVLVLLAAWALNLLGLPGNWINVAATAMYAWWRPGDERLAVGWWVVGALVGLAVVGELLELLAGAMGAARLGGSRRGAVFAVMGSIAGGLFGAFVGLPIPVIGSVIGVLLFAGVGALAGAVLGELWKGRDWDTSMQVGRAAMWGRMLGTLGKVAVGAAMVVVVLTALVL